MNTINCLLKERIDIENQPFYLIEEEESKRTHTIPANQIDIFEDVELNTTYVFSEEYNSDHNKTYYSLIHPDFQIGNELLMNIEEKREANDKIYFQLKSPFDGLSIKAFHWQKNLSQIRCKVIGYRRGKPVLRNIDESNPEWVINSLHNFKVVGFGELLNKKNQPFSTVVVKAKEGLEVQVRASQWHKPKIWNFSDIRCKIIGISKEGCPKLVVDDSRHPLYEKGKKYMFKIKNFETKTLKSGTVIQVINIFDSLNCDYEVLALPNQENKLRAEDLIECEVTDINTRLHLKQVNIDDPFFYSFEEIIEDPIAKKEYFDKYLDAAKDQNLKFISQYTQRSGFWVFTYCNHILPKLKRNYTDRREFSKAVEVINIHTKIENWILSKGILRAITNKEERKLIKQKIQQIIEDNNSEKTILQNILNFQDQGFFDDPKKVPCLKEIFFFIKYSIFEEINETDFIELLERYEKIELNPQDKIYLKKIIRVIQKFKANHGKQLTQDYFILSNSFDESQIKRREKYSNWLYIEIKLNKLLNNNKERNITVARLYRSYSIGLKESKNQKKLLLNAFFILTNPNSDIETPITFTQKRVLINIEQLPDNPNGDSKLTISEKTYEAEVLEKHYDGFKISVGETFGFLPTQNIVDKNLKYHDFGTIDWKTTIDITLFLVSLIPLLLSN